MTSNHQNDRQSRKKSIKNQRPILNNSDVGSGKLSRMPSNHNFPKKVSLNHLLNFSFPERQSHHQPKLKKSFTTPFNKERFVNANFRFILKPNYSIKDHLENPDIIVNWEDVLQMIMPISKSLTCPICLNPPVAPRATKCGHVYCWPCLTHYLSLSERSWAKCPICFDSIYPNALKSVLCIDHTPVEDVSPSKPYSMKFTLMRRSTKSTVVLPVAAHSKWKSGIPSVNFPTALTYAKLLLSTPDYIVENIIGKDEKDLKDLLKQIQDESNQIDQLSDENQKKKFPGDKANAQGENSEWYYFYQASDGQHYYLHPLDIKVLRHEFGTYDSFPIHLTLPVISIRESTDIRKRCKYLSHLPLACDINICEIDMSEVVSSTTATHFNAELSNRKSELMNAEIEKEREVRKSQTEPQLFMENLNVYATPAQSYEYSYEDFGPPLPSPSDRSFATPSSTPPSHLSSMSFARATMTPSASPSWLPTRTFIPAEPAAWSLDIPDDVVIQQLASAEVKVPGKGGKKKAKKILLFGNAGARGRG
ncbi:hypothetical protein HDV02_004337 [Globomyces sp. JEL0801]|nr:hypothetical protein HDV02_004337 [Globomyces sp. JEL0801]